MTDSIELMKYIQKAGMTVEELADALVMENCSLIAKIDADREFYALEIEKICMILDIPIEERRAIFFD